MPAALPGSAANTGEIVSRIRDLRKRRLRASRRGRAEVFALIAQKPKCDTPPRSVSERIRETRTHGHSASRLNIVLNKIRRD